MRARARPRGRDHEVPRRATTDQRWLRAAAAAAAVLAIVVATLVAALRFTVLDPSWYARGIGHVDAYERVYSQVLVDPAVTDVTDDLLAGLPVDPRLVESNLRVVVPPTTLRAVVNELVVEALAYLRGQTDTVDLAVPIDSVLQNVRELAASLVLEDVSAVPHLAVASLDDYAARVADLVRSIASGATPDVLPTVSITPDQVDAATNLLLLPLDDVARARAAAQVRFLLTAGDVDGATAVVVREAARDGALRSVNALETAARGTRFDPGGPIRRALGEPGLETVRHLRFVLGRLLPFTFTAALVVAAGALLLVALATREMRGRPAVWVGAVVVAGGLATLVTSFALQAALGRPFDALAENDTSLAPSIRNLLEDVASELDRSLASTIARTAVQPLLWGGALVAAAVLLPLALRAARDPARRTVAVSAAAVVGIGVVATAWVSAPAVPDRRPVQCNGSAALCDRSYADVTYPAAHNAMAAADAGFLGAEQDLTIGDQLALGIRALLLDTHHWETPAEVEAFLAAQPPSTRAVLSALVDRVSPPEPGTWLCHDLCQLGATRLVDGLRTVRDFVAAHPDEVVTLVLEDHISAEDTVAAFHESGLDRYAFTPDPDPAAPWPTLRQMIESRKTVVVLSQRHDGPAPWLTRLYDRAMETPFDVASADDFTCDPGRGGTGKPLFLLNHWVSGVAPSRSDAARVNRRLALVARARACESIRGVMPTYLAVDFVNVGDVVGAARDLNAIRGAERGAGAAIGGHATTGTGTGTSGGTRRAIGAPAPAGAVAAAEDP